MNSKWRKGTSALTNPLPSNRGVSGSPKAEAESEANSNANDDKNHEEIVLENIQKLSPTSPPNFPLAILVIGTAHHGARTLGRHLGRVRRAGPIPLL